MWNYHALETITPFWLIFYEKHLMFEAHENFMREGNGLEEVKFLCTKL
jgi:hypothetical protein